MLAGPSQRIAPPLERAVFAEITFPDISARALNDAEIPPPSLFALFAVMMLLDMAGAVRCPQYTPPPESALPLRMVKPSMVGAFAVTVTTLPA